MSNGTTIIIKFYGSWFIKITKAIVPNISFGHFSKSFKLGMARERESAQQSGEEVVDGVGKQRAWGDMNRRHIALTEVELSQVYVWK